MADSTPAPLDNADSYDSESDARTLQEHSKIVGDPDRHAAAHKHLQKQFGDAAHAMKQSKKALHGKVRKGLKAAFPDDTPFNKAARNGGTPFESNKAGQSSDED